MSLYTHICTWTELAGCPAIAYHVVPEDSSSTSLHTQTDTHTHTHTDRHTHMRTSVHAEPNSAHHT